MNTVIHGVNQVCTFLFSLMYYPFQALPPFWSLTVISLITGILMLWIFGKISNQDAIKKIKSKIGANLIAVRLFKEDLWVFFLIQGRILRDTLVYMKYSLMPMLVMLVPVVLIIIQLHQHYAYRPLAVGEQTLIKVKVIDDDPLKCPDAAAIEPSTGFTVETQGIRIPSEREITWRIRAEENGRHLIQVKIGDRTATKELRVGNEPGLVNSLRTGTDVLALLLYPGEAPIDPSTGIQSIEIVYPPQKIAVLGWEINWLVQFFIMSILFGYALKGVFGVQV